MTSFTSESYRTIIKDLLWRVCGQEPLRPLELPRLAGVHLTKICLSILHCKIWFYRSHRCHLRSWLHTSKLFWHTPSLPLLPQDLVMLSAALSGLAMKPYQFVELLRHILDYAVLLTTLPQSSELPSCHIFLLRDPFHGSIMFSRMSI